MRKINYEAILHLIVLNSCSDSLDYNIERKFKSLIANDNCLIEFYFPEMRLKDSRLNLIELNDLLEQFPDYEYQGHRCDEANVNKRIVKGDYKIMLQEDDILSIEFMTHISQVGEQSTRTVYHSLVMNPKEFNENKYSLDPESLFSNFDRKVLKKHVENFNKTNNQTVNLLAYDTGSNYAITWGLTKETFILYVGGEGEAFGYDKIEIPIDEIKNNR
jgi:hypothetical protein